MKNRNTRRGFTLIELLVGVVIIGVLTAVAVPQYKRAILKSRFTTIMPMAKVVADAQEVYYLSNNQYALETKDLDITPLDVEKTEVKLSTIDEDGKYNYVLARRTDFPSARYIMYQKHSENFPGNIHCEALTGDTQAEQLCQALGGEYVSENGNYTAYLLSGDGTNGTFDKECRSEPETEQTCSTGCGVTTREAKCNTKTGEWSYGEWKSCPSAPQYRILSVQYADVQGTRVCVNGEWEYEWTGNRTTERDCNVHDSYGCAGAIMTSDFANCRIEGHGPTVYGCYGVVFEGKGGRCFAETSTACNHAEFIGQTSHCVGNAANGCQGATVGTQAFCVANVEGGCNGVHYEREGNSRGCCYSTEGFCPVGSPKCGGTYSPYYMANNSSVVWNSKCWGEGGTEVDCED